MPLDPWPVELPQSLLMEGYTENFPNGAIRTKTSTGPGKSRRRTSSNIGGISGQMLLTSDEVVILEGFLKETLLDKSLPFTFLKPRDGATVLTVMFKDESPTIVPAGMKFLVSIALDVYP